MRCVSVPHVVYNELFGLLGVEGHVIAASLAEVRSPLGHGGVHTSLCLLLCPAWGKVAVPDLAARLLGVAAVPRCRRPHVTLWECSHFGSSMSSHFIYVIIHLFIFIFGLLVH